MAAPRLFVDAAAQSTVSGSITAAQTSVTVASGAGFGAPSGGQQLSVVILDSGNAAWNAANPFATPYEYQQVNNVTGNVLQFGVGGGAASRVSYAGTTNKSFFAGATVAAVLLAEDLAASFRQKIAEVTTTAGGSVSFTSIPGTFRNLTIKYTARDNGVGTNVAFVTIRFNNDSAANYTTELVDVTGTTTPTDNETLLGTSGNAGLAMQGGNAANRVCRGWIEIPNYADGFLKNWLYQAVGSIDNTTGKQRVDIGGGYWNAANAITQIDLATTANFAASCIFSLYGEA